MSPVLQRAMVPVSNMASHSFRRLVHTSSSNQAVAASLSTSIPAAMTLPRIFDIFDAPVRLGESSLILHGSIQNTRRSSTLHYPHPRPQILPPLSSLTPIVFDGPARPRNVRAATIDALRSKRASSPVRAATSSISRVPLITPEPLVQLFSGPARISRYPSPKRMYWGDSNHNKYGSKSSNVHVVVFGTLAGTFGYATYKKLPAANSPIVKVFSHGNFEPVARFAGVGDRGCLDF